MSTDSLISAVDIGYRQTRQRYYTFVTSKGVTSYHENSDYFSLRAECVFFLYAQEQFEIAKVKENYAVINRGSNDGIAPGDAFKVVRTDNEQQFGEIEVMKTRPTMSAVRLVRAVSGYTLKIGDVILKTEDVIVNELLREAESGAPKEKITPQRTSNALERGISLTGSL